MSLDTAVEVAMESETDHGSEKVNKMGQKTRKQTRFSIASSPLGTITNVFPGAGSPAKKDDSTGHWLLQNIGVTTDQLEAAAIADLDNTTDSSDENEVFFGPLTDYEKRKASKLRRRTVVFTPNFRAKLSRTPSKANNDGGKSSDESMSNELESVTEPENPADFTDVSVFNDSVLSDNVHRLDFNQKSSDLTSKRSLTSSTFYSASEFPGEDESFLKMTTDDYNESVYHQALSVSDIPSEGNDSNRQTLTMSEDEATPENTVFNTVEKSHNNLVLTSSKVTGSYTKAFKDMSSLKEKSAKFLEELRMEQRSRGNTPTNSPLPKKIAKRVQDDTGRELTDVVCVQKPAVQPTALLFDDNSSSSETHSSQEDLSDVDGKNKKSSSDLGESDTVSDVLKLTANRLQHKSYSMPTNAGHNYGNTNPSHHYGTPQSKYSTPGMSHNLCNSPLVFSSPKVFPVTVQAQSTRNPMCSVTYSPHTPNQSLKMSSANLSSPAIPHQPPPVVATPRAFTPGGISSSSSVSVTMSLKSPHHSLQGNSAFLSPAGPHKPSPVVALSRAFRPVNDNVKTQDLIAIQAISAGSAFHSVFGSGSPAPHPPFNLLPSTGEQNAAIQQVSSTDSGTPNRENMLDSPNVTRRSRKRNAANSPLPVYFQRVVRPLPVNALPEAVNPTISCDSRSPGVHIMQQPTLQSRHILVGAQESSSSPHQQLMQMSQQSLLQQKQEELARIRAEKEMLKQKIKEDNKKCFQMKNEIVAALKSNTSPEGLPPTDSHIVIFRPEGTSALTLNDQELDVVTRLHTIRNSNASAREQTYDSPVAHDRHNTGRVRLQWHDDLVTLVDRLSSPHLNRLHAPVTAHSILIKK